jgi:pimeloyl-ACP methyl ester carboxylesterase
MSSAVSTEVPPRPKNVERINRLLFRSDFLYWLVARYLTSSVLFALGATPEIRAAIIPEEYEWLSHVLEAMHPMSMRGAGNFVDSTPRKFDFPLYRIAAPTFVIHARNDTIVPFSQGEHTASRIPNARLVEFSDGGHLKLGHLTELKKHVLEFLHQNNEKHY